MIVVRPATAEDLRTARLRATASDSTERGVFVAADGARRAGFVSIVAARHGTDPEPRPAGSVDSILEPVAYGAIEVVEGDRAAIAPLVDAALAWASDRRLGAVHADAREGDDLLAALEACGFRRARVVVRRPLADLDAETGGPAPRCRRAGRNDVPVLAALVRREVEEQQRLAGWFRLRPAIDWPAFTAARLERSDGIVLVGEEAGAIAGYVEARFALPGPRSLLRSVLRRDRLAPPGGIEDVFVLAAHRRRGLAAGLLRSALGELRRRGVATVQAGIYAGNEPSLGLFSACGFAPARWILRREP